MCVCFFNCFIIYTNLPAGKSSIMMHIMSQAPPSPPPPANTHYYLPVDGNIKLFFDVSVLYHFYDKRSRSIVLNRGIGPGKSGERGFFRLRAPTSPNSRRGLLLRSTFGITWNHWLMKPWSLSYVIWSFTILSSGSGWLGGCGGICSPGRERETY